MEKEYKQCQSCGMPFKNDPQGGGTNADGSKSKMYCSNCYQNGRFTQPNWTVEQMQAFVKGKLKELGWFHRLFGGLFVKQIPKLERWKR
jgi:protein-arginine kinase activator protein McsA